MNVIDIHAHIYERVAGITRGQPMVSTGLGRVAIGNEEVQFLPPSFEQKGLIKGLDVEDLYRHDRVRRFLCLIPITGTITGTLRTA